jgi:membrane protease YdiL (CAAX protease family)
MRTAIGQHLHSSPADFKAAAVVAGAVVTMDFALAWSGEYLLWVEGRGTVAALALAAHVRLANGDLAGVGLRLRPVQGWGYWVRAAILIGLAVLACVAGGLGAWVLAGRELPVYSTAPAEAGSAFLRMCLFAPVQEETIYRLALCVPLAVRPGPCAAIAASGLLFGGMHWAAGTPSPENLVGGFLLAWAYLKSGSIAVPVLLHGLGNLFALGAQVGMWYWSQGAV